MATTRFNLIQWVDDTTAVDRTQFNDAFASIDNLGAGYTQSTGAPAAASADKVGFVHFNTTDETLFYCDGTDWHQINVFGNTTDATISAITPGDSKAAGSSTELAKADHVHEMPAFGSISNLASSTSSTNGSAATFARSDHNHGIPNGTITNGMLAGSITGSKIAAGTIQGSNILSTTTITADTYLVGGDDGITNVTGNYGSVQTVGSGAGGYEGYSIDGHTVFMAQSSTGTYGLYDDQNNQWSIAATRNGETNLYYNGSLKLNTSSSGVTVDGTVTATTFSGNASSATDATNATNVNVSADSTTSSTRYILFSAGTGNTRASRDTGLYYQPSTNKLTAGLFSGSGASLTNLNGSNISSGTVPTDRIPDLSANKITSDVININRIPDIGASKIDAGTFGSGNYTFPNNLTVSGGLTLGGRDLGEIVSFTPTWTNASGFQSNSGYYAYVKDLVYVSIETEFSASVSVGSTIRVDLPVSASDTHQLANGMMQVQLFDANEYKFYQGMTIPVDANTVEVRYNIVVGNEIFGQPAGSGGPFTFADGDKILISGWYRSGS